MRILDPKIENPILHLIGEEADRLGLECYVIGGWVRDLFLHRPSNDIDVVVAKLNGERTEEIERTKLNDERTEEIERTEGEHQRSGIGILLAERVAKRLGKGAHLSVFKTYGTAQVKWRKPTPTLSGTVVIRL